MRDRFSLDDASDVLEPGYGRFGAIVHEVQLVGRWDIKGWRRRGSQHVDKAGPKRLTRTRTWADGAADERVWVET